MTVRREVEVGPQGRVVIPAAIRKDLGLEPGTRLLVLIDDGAVVLLRPELVEKRLKAMFAAPGRSLADELIAERRAEAAAEAAR